MTTFTARSVGKSVVLTSRVTGGRWSPMRRTVKVRLFMGGKEYGGSGREGMRIVVPTGSA